jgi:hypothetical protein
MTLILTAANTSGVYQSSDYQLTDRNTGAPLSDQAGCKQLQAQFKDLELQLAFTGIADVLVGSRPQRTIDWFSEELKALPHNVDLQDICDALVRRSASVTASLGIRGILEIVLIVAQVGAPFRVAVISNVDWSEHPATAKPRFKIKIRTITKPFTYISGYRDAVPAFEEHRLRALATSTNKSTQEIENALAEINAIAAKNSRGYVSEGCWVASLFADGRVRKYTTKNAGGHHGDVHLVQFGQDLTELLRKSFQPSFVKNLRFLAGAGAIGGPGDGTPVPRPTGEPRRFTLFGSHVAATLYSPARRPCATVAISPIAAVIEMRCNEEATVPVARIMLNGVKPIGEAFRKPLLPWVQVATALTIDDAPVPRGCTYTVGYWIEDGAHQVIIPDSHRSIRNVGFLGPTDELVIVVPPAPMEFVWGERDEAPATSIYARVWWRSRLDGTHG